jgi:Flp pilus assembly protein TadD
MAATRRSTSRPVALRLTLAVSLAAMLAVSGCASSKRSIGTHASATQGYVTPGSDAARQAVGYWGQAYERDPANRDNILNYAAALRRNGQVEQAASCRKRFRSSTVPRPPPIRTGA